VSGDQEIYALELPGFWAYPGIAPVRHIANCSNRLA
jgi:hypothetical protein